MLAIDIRSISCHNIVDSYGTTTSCSREKYSRIPHYHYNYGYEFNEAYNKMGRLFLTQHLFKVKESQPVSCPMHIIAQRSGLIIDYLEINSMEVIKSIQYLDFRFCIQT